MWTEFRVLRVSQSLPRLGLPPARGPRQRGAEPRAGRQVPVSSASLRLPESTVLNSTQKFSTGWVNSPRDQNHAMCHCIISMPDLSASRIFSKLRMVFGVRFFLRMRSRSSSCPMNITRVYFAKLLQRGGNVSNSSFCWQIVFSNYMLKFQS